jgi:hypothetical protein
MKVFAIRHKPTGEWMPHRLNRTPGGWSHWIPGDELDKPHDANPRLFFTLQSARNALTMWLQGKWKRDQGTSYSFDGPEGYDEMTVNAPPVPRTRGDMEIVELELRGA